MESHDMKYRYTGTRLVLLVLTGISLSATKTVAQTTVQLPTVQRFGVSTTVVVPAGRSVSLGAIGRSSRGRNGFGTPFGGPLPGLGNRSFGGTSSTGSISMSATIIDHDRIDRALLAEAARRRVTNFS